MKRNMTDYIIRKKGVYCIDREDLDTGEQIVQPGDVVSFYSDGKERVGTVSEEATGRDDDLYVLTDVREMTDADRPWTFKFEIEFDERQVTEILDAVNFFFEDNPITLDEFKANPEMQEYMRDELACCDEEIVDGSKAAIANDWLMDIGDYRK